uniref:hypothetical protein n=1 Tax=Streptomyces flavovirens TaxID=52258 RepID=UPI00131E5591|nr:hypothetical protein [Streptomyces flavovirens]
MRTTACGVSRTTIRRRREAVDLPNGGQDTACGWLIPVDDLLAAELRLDAYSPPDEAASPNLPDRRTGRCPRSRKAYLRGPRGTTGV